jgi:hypothetical protein
MDQFLQQLLLSTGSSLNSSGTNWTNSSSGYNQMARLARLLNSNSTCLWTAPWLLNYFSLFCWTPSYCSVLWAPRSGLKRPHMDCKEITDFPCWSVTVDSLPWERQSTMSLVSAVVGSYPRYLPLSGYFETHHSMLHILYFMLIGVGEMP